MTHARLRPALALAALLMLLAPAVAGAAGPSVADQLRAAHAIERYYATYGSPRPIPPPPVATIAPAPRRPAPRPAAAPLTHGGPGWNAAVIAGAVLVAVGAGLGVLAGRDSMRPRRT
jgi:hypothetical protein